MSAAGTEHAVLMEEYSKHSSMKEYRQRMTTKQWRWFLLNHMDSIIWNGNVVRLIAESLGAGVVEITKEINK